MIPGTSGSKRIWGVILASGDAQRLRALTRTAAGAAVPLPFCSLFGRQMLIEAALARAAAVVPRERLCAVVAAEHRQWWTPLLWSLRASNRIVQPANLGTGMAVLHALLVLAARDANGLVALLPSDHHFVREAVVARGLRHAADYVARHDGETVLLGATAELAPPELGYIVPGRDVHGAIRTVERFIEKPSPVLACELVQNGALCNTAIALSSLRTLLRLYERRFSRAVQLLQRWIEEHGDAEGPVLPATLAAQLPPIDFSRDVLQGHETALRVMHIGRCGWADVGVPRVLEKVVHDHREECFAPTLQEAQLVNLAVQLRGANGGDAAWISGAGRSRLPPA